MIEFTELVWPPPPLEVTGIFVLSFVSILGCAGGSGGGGTNIPFMMLFFGLSIKECVPLANIFGLISALMRFIINFKEKHPNNPQRTTIDYEIVTLSMSMLYLGTLIGVRIGHLMTSQQVLSALVFTLCYVIFTSLNKAISLYKKENAQKEKKEGPPERLSINVQRLSSYSNLI